MKSFLTIQEIGRAIRNARINCKLSQRELAKLVGVSQNLIYLLETSRTKMDLVLIDKICKELKCVLTLRLGGKEHEILD
jgi:transcriptional regulator with XRE-family HTH domain